MYTGHAIRLERRRIGMPLATLAALSGLSVSSLSAAENGQGLLRESVRERVVDALNRVDRVRLVLLPGKLDMRDAGALRAALEAFDRGDLPRAAEHATAPKLPNPLVVNF